MAALSMEKRKTTMKPLRVRDPHTASRLMGKIILLIQMNLIGHKKARLLIYALSNFVGIHRDNILDERLRDVEKELAKIKREGRE